MAEPRQLQLPPPDRAFWLNPGRDDVPLAYLAWGERRYGNSPIQAMRHQGWVFALVERGAPLLMRGLQRERVPAGTFLVLGPDCDYGWQDQPGKPSHHYQWMWRQVRHERLRALPSNFFEHRALEREEIEWLRAVHALTRRETWLLDADSPKAFGGLQDLLEVSVVRWCVRSLASGGDDLMTRAKAWMEEHVSSRQPLARLADYLAVSPSTVQRLFREQMGKSFMDVINAQRQQKAWQMLATGDLSVKAVAHELGYKHANDFTRAFRRAFGRTPASVKRKHSHY